MGRLEAIHTADPVKLSAALLVAALEEAIASRGRFLIVLAGGKTPAPLYRRLAELPNIPWKLVSVFLSDERFVPERHPESNARMVRESLLDLVTVPEEQFHRWPILDTPERSAAAYAATISRNAGDPPLFDFSLLGLGADCHTASLFPSTGTHSATGSTVASRPPTASGHRLSLTAAALSRSRTVLFLATGVEKRAAIANLVADTGDTDTCPARAVGAVERLLLITDQQLMR